MRTLEAPPRPKCLLSFDFDGTLHHPADHPSVPRDFFEIIRRLREEKQAIWGINTGRSLPQMLDGFQESEFPFLPDWVITREHEIHYPDLSGRWSPHKPWNQQGEKAMHQLFRESRPFLRSIRKDIEEQTGAQWIEMDGEPAGIIAKTEEEMEWIASQIAERCAHPELGWQRNSIYLRFGHTGYQKGSSLGEVAQKHGLSSTACFAIGDSHNDLEMLDPLHAAMIACPSNAISEVKEKVLMHGGYLANQSHGAGACEALHHFFG